MPTNLSRKRKINYHSSHDETELSSNPVSKVLRLKETNLNLIPSYLPHQAKPSHSNGFLPTNSQIDQSYNPQAPFLSSSNLPYNNHSHCSLSSNIISSRGSVLTSSYLMQTATDDVVTKAIDCLLYDESHTLDLLARRGQEVHCRRLSLPLFSSSTNVLQH